MERKILKISSVLLMITIAAALGLKYYSNTYGKEMQQEQMSGLKMLAYNTEQAEMSDEAEFEQQLCIELPEGMTLDEVIIENDYVKQLITIEIPDVENNYFLEHPLLGRSNNINDLYMADGRIEITMDAVYEPECTVEDGHGGGAPGAIKQGIMEKDINLAIVKELKEILDKNDRNIGVYYTRTEDVNPTFEQRAQLGGKAGANLFISVHSNSTVDGLKSCTMS